MVSVALVSILCPDRVGLVSAVADHLFSAGVNLRDTTFAVLGQGAELTSLCELPAGLTAGRLQGELTQLPALAGAQIKVVPYGFDPAPGPQGKVTHVIEIAGGDQLGLIARLADVFAQFGANIVRLDARKLEEIEGGRAVTRFQVWLPAERAGACLAAVTNTAGTMRLSCRIDALSP